MMYICFGTHLKIDNYKSEAIVKVDKRYTEE